MNENQHRYVTKFCRVDTDTSRRTVNSLPDDDIHLNRAYYKSRKALFYNIFSFLSQLLDISYSKDYDLGKSRSLKTDKYTY